MSDVILKALKDMQPGASNLLDRAYAAGHRAGQRAAEHKAVANIAEGFAVARAELSLCSLSERVDALADTVNENFAVVAKAIGTEFEDDGDEVCTACLEDLLAEQARNNEAMVRSAIAELLGQR